MTPPEPARRAIAIVGRPNVGKSAIFNRLAGRRVAIVHAAPGVTRDRLAMEACWNDERFELIDTGGIGSVRGERAGDRIAAGIRTQVEAALQDAVVALMVVDIDAGVLPLDEEVAGLLHASGVRTFVAANKADHAGRDAASVEFNRFGFPVFAVSALHDRGFGELMDRVVPCLPRAENVTARKPLRVAVVGRPNVGKSSYVNRLINTDRLIVSDVPGTTRDSVDVPFTVGRGGQARHYVLIDTAGMRRSGKIDNAVERFGRMRTEESIERSDIAVLVMDAAQGPTAHDKTIAALVQEHRKGCVILVNKWDLSETTQRQYGPALMRAMPFLDFCPVVYASAVTGFNVRRSVDAIDLVASQVTAALPTGVLNRVLMEAAERVHSPSVKGKSLNVFYATQVGVAPIRIRVFVNHERLAVPAYRKFLVKSLRASFGLEGAPVTLDFRARPRGRKGEPARRGRVRESA